MNSKDFTKNNSTNKCESKPFIIKAYGKEELAKLYLPNLEGEGSARKTFNGWIKTSPGLQEALAATGLTPNAKIFTPLQVRLIVEALDPP